MYISNKPIKIYFYTYITAESTDAEDACHQDFVGNCLKKLEFTEEGLPKTREDVYKTCRYVLD